ncbi:MAG: glycerophosphodiester phosphodiesterase [Gammaproteobacteria bacterium]|nr:glycerophosphodiester phosphodiesterase [Gammaproteobacteria bacterium]
MAGKRPLVIAHRGASAYLPEHTLAGKAMAHAMGADFLEQDVVATRDGELIVFHDLYLDDLTDVAQRFPGRARPDGRHYCIDFDLAEIRRLALTERRRAGDDRLRYPGRFPATAGSFTIPTLEEEIRFIQGLNHSTGRSAGIYPEIKSPAWHHEHGIDLAARMLGVLGQHGYSGSGDAAIVQCFDGGELKRLRNELGCGLRLVQLLEGELPAGAVLEAIRRYAEGIGPSLRQVLGTGLVTAAHRAGLQVHPYTLRLDALPEGCRSFGELMDVLCRGDAVDGLFSDFPDLVLQYLNQHLAEPS